MSTEDLSWGRSTVDTSCPLDCPDACSLAVSVEQGRVTKIDGSHRHAVDQRASSAPRSAASADASTATIACSVPEIRTGPKGKGQFRARLVGRSARRHRQPDRRGADAERRRSDPALLLRRLERPAHAGLGRRALLPPARRLAARAHGVRRADGRGGARPLRQDVRRRLRGLPRRAPDRGVGRQSVGVGHPPRAATSAKRSARARRSW